ncbi:MAG TPA: chemotaxis protein CheW [Rudaea sp.]
MNTDVRLDDYIGDLLADAAPAPAPAPAAMNAPAPAPSQRIAAPAPALPSALIVELPPPRAPVARPKRWLCFSVGGENFAIELLKVQEVQRVPPIVPVRGAASDTLGVINLRGEIVHVIDLGLRLGFGPCVASEASRVVVLEENGQHAGLLVSSVASVITLDDASIERPESTLRTFPCPALAGIARTGRTLVALLDGSRFLQ